MFCTPFYFVFSRLSYPRRSATECEFSQLSKSYFLELKICILVLSTSNPGRHPFIVGHVQGHVQCPLQQVLVGYFGGRGCPWLPENWRREWILRAATSAGKEWWTWTSTTFHSSQLHHASTTPGETFPRVSKGISSLQHNKLVGVRANGDGWAKTLNNLPRVTVWTTAAGSSLHPPATWWGLFLPRPYLTSAPPLLPSGGRRPRKTQRKTQNRHTLRAKFPPLLWCQVSLARWLATWLALIVLAHVVSKMEYSQSARREREGWPTDWKGVIPKSRWLNCNVNRHRRRRLESIILHSKCCWKEHTLCLLWEMSFWWSQARWLLMINE